MEERLESQIDISVVGDAAEKLAKATSEAEKLAKAEERVGSSASAARSAIESQAIYEKAKWPESRIQDSASHAMTMAQASGKSQVSGPSLLPPSPLPSKAQSQLDLASGNADRQSGRSESGLSRDRDTDLRLRRQDSGLDRNGLDPYFGARGYSPSSGLTTAVGAGLAYAAVSRTAGQIGTGVSIAQNQSLTNTEKMRGIMELIPGLGQFMRAIDAVTGTLERMRAATERYQLQAARQTEYFHAQSQVVAQRRERDEAFAQVQGIRSVPYARFEGGQFDRRTVGGNIQLQEYMQRLSADDQVVRAERQRNAAAAALQSARQETQRQSRAETLARYESESLIGGGMRLGLDRRGEVTNARGNGRLGSLDRASNQFAENRASTMETLRQGMIANNEAIARGTALEQQRTNEMRSQIALAQAEKALGDARVSRLQTELGILQQREQRMASAQERLGSMNAGQRELAISAMQHLQENGIENAPSELLDLARQIDPSAVSQMAQNYGGRLMDGLRARGVVNQNVLSDFRDGQTLQGVQQQQIELQGQIRVEVNVNEAALAERIAAAQDERLRTMISRIDVRLTQAIAAVALQMRARNISGGN